jgi:DNA end-binding protein Ku
MPPRSLWSGSISFGLVNVPVRLYPAIAEHKLHFNLVHEPDASRSATRRSASRKTSRFRTTRS